jgi:hypothetical protein
LEHLEIPAGVKSDAIVREEKLTSLQIGQSGQNNYWYLRQAKLASGSKAAMTCNDVAVGANEDRTGKSEGSDAAGDFGPPANPLGRLDMRIWPRIP